MKPLYYLIVLIFACVIAHDAFAQTQTGNAPTRRTRDNQQNNSGMRDLTVRAESKNEDQTLNIDNVVWLKEIYRWIDLTRESNAPLYYPAQPIDNRINLFTTIFKLMCEGKIKAYEFLGEREVFTEKYEIKFEEILKKFQIIYTTEKRGNQTIFVVDESDIPSNEATLYMIKEAWYFNQANGTFDKKILAICPLLVREEYDLGGEVTKNPLFWIPYENIRPYITNSYVMTSNVNNALTYTIDDFFRKGMYQGDILKTSNMMNLTLQQQYGDSIKVAQDSIENQLKFFEKQLWVPQDTTMVAAKGKNDKKSSSGSEVKSDDKKEDKKEEKQPKPQKTKTEKASSSPTKSVRRTR